ncbi:MAG: glycosyltransferase [Candidatus Magasanikbacteria bacterium]
MNSKQDKTKALVMVQTLASGGAERSATNVANHLDVDEVKLVLYENKIEYECDKEKIILNSPAGSNYFDKLWKFAKRVWRLRKIKKREKPDYTISFADGPSLVNILSKRDDKVIISIQNTKSQIQDEDPFARKIYHFLYKKLYKKADVITGVAKGVVKDLAENFNVPKDKTEVIYNSVDLELIQDKSQQPLSEEKQEIFDNSTIINVGRFTQQKGQWHLIRAFKKVKDQNPDAKLVFLGKGGLQNYLVDLAKNLDLQVYCKGGQNSLKPESQDVFFLGFVDNPFKYLANSDIFAFPSLWEGFSLVAIEAAACKLPIIAADCNSGPRELLAPETDIDYKTEEVEFAEYGIIIPVGDGKHYNADVPLTEREKMWHRVLNKILQKDQLREKYSKLAQRRAKDFSIESVIKDWHKVLNE